MAWRCEVICAAWALVLAGCLPFRAPAPGAGGEWDELVLRGSPRSVAPAAQSALSGMGLAVQADRPGDAIRLRSATPSGKRFALLLVGGRQVVEEPPPGHSPPNRGYVPSREVTHVRLIWEKDAEEGFWERVRVALGDLPPAR